MYPRRLHVVPAARAMGRGRRYQSSHPLGAEPPTPRSAPAGPAMAIFSQDPLSLQGPLICYLAQLVATFNSVDTDLIGPRQGTINNTRKL